MKSVHSIEDMVVEEKSSLRTLTARCSFVPLHRERPLPIHIPSKSPTPPPSTATTESATSKATSKASTFDEGTPGQDKRSSATGTSPDAASKASTFDEAVPDAEPPPDKQPEASPATSKESTVDEGPQMADGLDKELTLQNSVSFEEQPIQLHVQVSVTQFVAYTRQRTGKVSFSYLFAFVSYFFPFSFDYFFLIFSLQYCSYSNLRS